MRRPPPRTTRRGKSRGRRKPALRLVLVLLAAVTATSVLVATPASAVESYRVAGLPLGEGLSIREAPDAEAPSLGQLPVGARLRGFGCTSDTPSGLTWCRVKGGRLLGWARRRYLSPD
ncbi:SH3 domain-containing protein [Methylobacterium gossipiicola]|uniref:SH3 domain-containing protein n=1 Tax=Methylobacterium gossipiicola TaxID=582675 RepID=A0A1I2TWG0_9HYPH|nr:SH3 domain-containing protein [Methylobacterium gossipiicola]SFG69212.1 SH3 domain-containing protein [Methylobacterium gossipiicola]